MTAQLPLGLHWPVRHRLEDFVPGDNAAAVALVHDAACTDGAAWLYLSGPPSSGRSHLLVAACAMANEVGRSAQYLSLREAGADSAAVLRSVGGSQLLALDDVDAIAGDDAGEYALFDLYNRCRADGSCIIFAARAPAQQAPFALPDLVSRLAACTQVTLRLLDEGGRRKALRMRAQARGIELDDVVLNWLFTRGKRDLGSLTQLLDRIDRAALAEQRRVTIPFLRQVLNSQS